MQKMSHLKFLKSLGSNLNDLLLKQKKRGRRKMTGRLVWTMLLITLIPVAAYAHVDHTR